MDAGAVILEAGNAERYRTGDWRAFRPVWGEAECTNCFLCWLYCPDSSILVDPEGERMAGFDLDHCKGCGICAVACPVNGKVRRRLGGELERDDIRLCIRMVEEGAFSE